MVDVAAAAVAGGALFDYNRKNFFYDRFQRMKTELQMFEFRLNKQDMFREDVQDVCGLTSVKMDTYLIVNAIQIGFCIIALCEGRMEPGTPGWLVGAHLLSIICAFAFLLLSVWFAMHATIAAKAYEIRLLTQYVRLPIPSWSQLEASRTYGSMYEKMEARQMFRVPFLCGAQENISNGGCFPGRTQNSSKPQSESQTSPFGFPESLDQDDQSNATTSNVDMAADPWGLERCGDTIYELNSSLQSDPRKYRHIQLVREAMQYWQGSDAFARVSMSIGTSQFAIALAYYVLGYVLVYNHAIVGAWLVVILFLACAWALLRIDMSLTGSEYLIGTVLQVGGPLVMTVCVTLWELDCAAMVIRIAVPLVYFSHAAWLLYLTRLCKVVEQRNGAMVPTGFKAVLYIDVFGWIKRSVSANTKPSKFGERGKSLKETIDANNLIGGKGPAVQTIRYENGKPVPVRLEDLPDASREPEPSDGIREALAPSTFAPPHEDTIGERHWAPGSFGGKPWHVFSTLKLSFACIWILAGLERGLCSWGRRELVAQLHHSPSQGLLQFEEEPLASLVGEVIATEWPHENVQPLAFSCDSSRQLMTASSRHKIYTAHFGGPAMSNRIAFSNSPTCEEIEGDAIQDVSLQCSPLDSRPGSCRALVLHQKGRRLTSCSLKQNSTGEGASADISGTWLHGHDSTQDAPKERIHAFALPSRVGGASSDDQTAYIATGDHRLVKMQQISNKDGTATWFPRRVLGKSSIASGGMDVLGNRFLVRLSSDGYRLAAQDLLKGGLSVGSWRLPSVGQSWISKDKSWNAICATGDNLYLLGNGPSPKVWRFQLPEQLRLPRVSEAY